MPRPLNLWIKSHVNMHSSIVNRGSATQKTGLFFLDTTCLSTRVTCPTPIKSHFSQIGKASEKGKPTPPFPFDKLRTSGTPPLRGSFIELSSFPFLEGWPTCPAVASAKEEGRGGLQNGCLYPSNVKNFPPILRKTLFYPQKEAQRQ